MKKTNYFYNLLYQTWCCGSLLQFTIHITPLPTGEG